MRLSDSELRHFKNVDAGLRFWGWFRWVFIAVLLIMTARHVFGWSSQLGLSWLLLGGTYVLVAWPGLCRAYVFHAFKRLLLSDPEAREQLAAAGIKIPE